MVRMIIWTVYFVVYLLYSLILRPKVGRLEKQGKIKERDEYAHLQAKLWGKRMINFAGIKVKVTGAENIPQGQGVLFVGNHQSNLDIPILMGFIDKPKAFLAKAELNNYPIISKWMRYLGCVFIHRDDIKQSLKAIIQGAKQLKEGLSMVIFPEGTRSVDGSLGEFKPGSLKMATKSGAPIVPITIKGAFAAMPKKKFVIRPVVVEIIISPPIYIDKEISKDSGALMGKVRNIIFENLSSSK